MTSMAKKPVIHDLRPQPTIAKAVAASKRHVAAVNNAARKKGGK
jgi:hypothetical protein